MEHYVIDSINQQKRAAPPHHSVAFAAAASIAMLAACGDGGGRKNAAVSQVAAKVNREEISIHQVNHALHRQHKPNPEHAEAVSRQMLERLIEQELVLQKAYHLKIDREPRVLQAIEASRREVIAHAYAERVGELASGPSADEVRKYYQANPALFSDRRIYNLHEITVDAKPEQLDDVRAKLKAAKSVNDFVAQLRAADYRVGRNLAVRAAEQLPLTVLPEFTKLKDGQAMLLPAAVGAQIVFLGGSSSQPVDAARAKPLIEQYLLADRRRKLIDDDIKALRASSTIEYVGKFATAAPLAASAVAPVNSSAAAGAIDSETISKGLGLK